jgi:hypothetical protein
LCRPLRSDQGHREHCWMNRTLLMRAFGIAKVRRAHAVPGLKAHAISG